MQFPTNASIPIVIKKGKQNNKLISRNQKLEKRRVCDHFFLKI